jgi:hypothetical protein
MPDKKSTTKKSPGTKSGGKAPAKDTGKGKTSGKK